MAAVLVNPLFFLKFLEGNSGNNFHSYEFTVCSYVKYVTKEIIPRIPFENP